MNRIYIFLYDLAIQIYYLGIQISSPFNSKAKQWLVGRKGLLNDIKNTINVNDKIIWIHCSSVGEFEQGRPVIERLKTEYENLKILVTFFSPSGYAQRNKITDANYIFYLPLDTKKNAKEFIRITNPQLVIFVKYEFWFHFLNETSKKNIPALLISGIFRKNQLFFKWYGFPFLSLLKSFSKIFVQDNNSLILLEKYNLSNTVISSDTRFDRVLKVKNNAKTFIDIEKFCGDNKIIIAGSTWPEDEKILIQTIQYLKNSDLKWIIAPHEISEKHISALLNSLGEKAIRYSQLSNSKSNKQFLVIDNIGMLSSIYRYATIAFIGGGFGKGIHNILESTVFGVPVLFGPNYEKFREAKDLIDQQICFSINNSDQLSIYINRLLNDNKLYNNCSTGCSAYVENNSGATEQIMKYITTEIFKK